MFKKSCFFIFLINNLIFSSEITSLPIVVTGRIISIKTSVINEIEKGLHQIQLTNNFNSDIFIFGKIDNYPFLYKIKKNSTKNYRLKGDKITELFYILNNNKYELKTYADIYY